MTRNFGIPKVTSGTDLRGAEHRSRSHPHDTQRDSNIIQFASRLPPGTARLNSRPQEVEPFIHPFEFGSYCLLFGVLLLPALFVCAAVFFYAAFIA